MKRIISYRRAVFAGIAAMIALSGCGNTAADNAAGTSAQTTTAAQTTAATTTATEWTGDDIEVEALDEEKTLDVDIKGKKLKWLGFYDLNPTNDSPERSPELALFEDTYGAKIEYIQTTNETRFDDLANAILSGDSPDIFVYEWRAFPFDISKKQYQPIDSIIDWNEPKWADVKDIADSYIYKGEHYIAPLGYAFSDTQVLMYNKTLVEEEGLEDPYELYLKGEWDWDHFTGMMNEFVGGDEERYGIGGWWANAFVYTAGDTIVRYDGKEFINNIRSTNIEKAQSVIKDIYSKNLVERGWIGGESAFTDDHLLFYSMGTWAYNAAALSRPDDVIQIVPFPKNPGTDKYYVSNKVSSYMWVSGSKNDDLVKAWFDCCRTVNYEDSYKQATKDKFLKNNTGWTSEMYDIAMDFYDSSKFTQAYDYGYGLNIDMSDIVMPMLYEGIVNEQFEDWVQAREEYYSIVQESCDAYNE